MTPRQWQVINEKFNELEQPLERNDRMRYTGGWMYRNTKWVHKADGHMETSVSQFVPDDAAVVVQ